MDSKPRSATRRASRATASLRLGMSVFLNNDLKSAQRLLAEKESFRDLERAYAELKGLVSSAIGGNAA